MIREILIWVGISLVVCAVLALIAPAAEAGPPLICWPYDTGRAQSLPWGGSGWHDSDAHYDLRRLPEDTLKLLTPATPVLARMETLRRATVYAMKDRGIASDLLARLQARARDTEAQGRPDPLALFDLGYLISAYHQAKWSWPMGDPATGLEGYSLMVRAIRLRGQDAEMEFAAALARIGTLHSRESSAHLEAAIAGAEGDSPLAKNLLTHCHLFGKHATTLAELRAQVISTNH